MRKTLLLLLLAVAPIANAGLIYDESVSGDSAPWFSGGGEALGDVASGDFILGTMADTGPTPVGSSFWDGYNFVLDGSVSAITISVLSGGPFFNRWQLYDGVTNNILLEDLLTSSGSVFSISFDVAGLIGTYTLGNNGVVTSQTYDYQIAFDDSMSAVPAPPALALLGLCLAGLGLARRRRQA